MCGRVLPKVSDPCGTLDGSCGARSEISNGLDFAFNKHFRRGHIQVSAGVISSGGKVMMTCS